MGIDWKALSEFLDLWMKVERNSDKWQSGSTGVGRISLVARFGKGFEAVILSMFAKAKEIIFKLPLDAPFSDNTDNRCKLSKLGKNCQLEKPNQLFIINSNIPLFLIYINACISMINMENHHEIFPIPGQS